MKRILVLYKSKYGSIKTYSQWIGEELSCDIMDFKDFKKKMMDDYDIFIYGGGVHAGGIRGFDDFSKYIKWYKDKKTFLVFTCGINVKSFDGKAELRRVNFDKDYLRDVSCFYFDGDYDPDSIKGIDKKIMNWSKKVLLSKGNLNMTKDDKELFRRMNEGFHGVSKDEICGLIERVKEIANE